MNNTVKKSLFAIDFAENTIIASKTTLKKASNPNSAEYKEMMKLMKQNPTFTVAEKVIKEAVGKNTHKGLDKPFIEKFISIQTNSADLKKQYDEVSKMGKFPLVRKWFLNTFKDFDMDKAKEAIEQALFAKIGSVCAKQADAEQQRNLLTIAPAANH